MLPRIKILPSLAWLAGRLLLRTRPSQTAGPHQGLKTWTLLRGTARIAHWTLPPHEIADRLYAPQDRFGIHGSG